MNFSFIWEVFKRDLKGQYRESIGGYLWALIPTFVNLAAFVLAQKSMLINYSGGDLSYLIYAFSGLILWQGFSDGVNIAMGTLDKNRALITKLNFPIFVLYFSKIIEISIYHLIRVVVFLMVLVATGKLHWVAILSLTYMGFGTLLLGHLIGVLLSPFCMVTGDVARGVPFLLQIAMWMTPVFLKPAADSMLGRVVAGNPLASYFSCARAGLLGSAIDFDVIYLWPLFTIPLLYLVYFFVAMILPIVNERATA